MATPGGSFLMMDPHGALLSGDGAIPRTRTATGARQHVPIFISPNIRDDDDEDDDEEIDVGISFGIGAAPPIKKRMEKAKWSANEDGILKRAVEQHDGKNWKLIASHLDGKTEVQCLHRWTKVLNPNLTKGPWTEEVGSQLLH